MSTHWSPERLLEEYGCGHGVHLPRHCGQSSSICLELVGSSCWIKFYLFWTCCMSEDKMKFPRHTSHSYDFPCKKEYDHWFWMFSSLILCNISKIKRVQITNDEWTNLQFLKLRRSKLRLIALKSRTNTTNKTEIHSINQETQLTKDSFLTYATSESGF